MEFITAIVNAILAVFTSYVPGLASAVVDMFEGLFWTPGAGEAAGSLTLLAQGLIGIAAIGIVSSVFYLIYKIFRGRMKKRV